MTKLQDKQPFVSLSRYTFSSNGEEPPKGFEKFKRQPKDAQDKKQDTQESTQKEQSIKQENTENKSDQDPFKAANTVQENQDDDVKNEENKEQPKKKKFTFTYDPKSFNFNQGKKDKKDESDKKEDQDQKPKKESQFKFDFDAKAFFEDPNKRYMGLGALLLGGAGLAYYLYDTEETISYTEFARNYLESDKVKKIYIQKDGNTTRTTAIIVTNQNQELRLILGNVDHFLENLERVQLEKGKSPEYFIPVEFRHAVDTNKMIDRSINIIYLGVSLVIAFTLFRSLKSTMGQMNKGGGGNDFFGFGKSNVKQFGFEQTVKVKFRDVAGLDEAKSEIQEFVDFLKKPRKYKEIGAKIPRGALLAGPPGTGKTMMAKACAGEAGVPFFYVSGSDFVEMFVGVGASRVRDLFKQAKQKSPSIVFIDEIDAVGRKRESRLGGNDERDNTLNQLLVEMDGFGTDTNVIVLAATNRKELLDPALTRPGRFDRTVDITLPDIEGRKQIFMVHLSPLKLDQSKSNEEYAKRLATLTPGFSGAEIANLCNEAAIIAARKNKTTIDSFDFEMASERVMAGLEKKKNYF